MANTARWRLAGFAQPRAPSPGGKRRPLGKAQALCWLIGPEGGFSAEEEALAQAHGATPVYLGERILRVETAALAALVTGQALA